MMHTKELASYFLSRAPMRINRLQIMCYYAQGISIKMNSNKLANLNFEAWVMGPISRKIRDLFNFSSQRLIPMVNISEEEREKFYSENDLWILDHVFSKLSVLSDDELIALVKSDQAWLNTRQNLHEWEPSTRIIIDENMKLVDLDPIGRIQGHTLEEPISFGFKLWNFSYGNTDEELGASGWFQEILSALAVVTGLTKNEMIKLGYLNLYQDVSKTHSHIDFISKENNSEQYEMYEIKVAETNCSLYGVFIASVFYLIWFESKLVRGPNSQIDERLQMAIKAEQVRKSKTKMFELEKENQDLQVRNKELWDLLDEMTDPKVKMYKQ